MTVRTDAVLLAIESLLAGVQGPDESGVLVECRVEIDRVIPHTREDAPAVNLRFESEDVQQYGGAAFNGHEQVRNRARLEVEIYTRGLRPLLLCGAVFEAVHARLMADPTIGGRLAALNYAGRRWQSRDADGAGGWLTGLYDLIYIASERTLD